MSPDTARFGWPDRVDATLDALEHRIATLEESQAALNEHLMHVSAQVLTLVKLTKDIARLVQTLSDDDDSVH